MEIRQLKHFLAVYERRHYGRAATHVGLSQSALTKSIAKLESGLQVKLFERGRYGAVPTPFGESLAQRARIILAEERLAGAEINDLKGASRGTVQFGMGFSCAHRIVPRALLRLEKSHPGVSAIAVEGASRDLVERLLQGELDFVVGSPPDMSEPDPELRAECVFRDRDLVVCSRNHPLARRPQVPLADLAGQPWAVSHRYPEMLRHIHKVFVAEGVAPPQALVRTDSLALMLALVLDGDHLALFSEEFLAVQSELAAVRELRGSPFRRQRTGYLLQRRRTRLQPAAAALVEHVRAVCRELYGTSPASPG
jgi:DNA-binding transcriptional LysR family regulator